jgi:CHAT domain-containing protein
MSARSYRLAVAAVLLATSITAGCFQSKFRLTSAVPSKVLYAARADLPGMVMQLVERGQLDEAFYVLEVHKTRDFAAPRLAARDPAFATQLARAHRDLRPLFAAAFTAGPEVVASRGLHVVPAAPGASTPAITEAHVATDRAFWDHLRIVEARFDAALPYAHVLRGSFAPTTTEEAALMFDRRELFVSYFIHGSRVYAFVLGASGKLLVVPLPTPVPALQAATRALRAELDQPPATGRELAWQAPASQLYDALLGPIAQRVDLSGVEAVYVSPDGFLAGVPFAALVTGGHPVLERLRVTYLPSASMYRHLLQEQALDQPPRFLAIGNPAFSVDVPALAFAGREAETLSFVFDDATLLTGAQATETRIDRAFASHNIFHFATHGVLLEAPGASSLMVAAGDDGQDGFLSAAEIAGMDLSHSYLAVLSACETAVTSDGGATDLASLTSAFMAAGVPGVIGSLWKVADTSTTRLMLDFYREFLATGSGEALRRAQLALAANPAYRHPYYWAPFLLYGWDK